MEPPRTIVPARAGLTISAVTLGRVAAATAALVLAVLSRGDAFVLALLLAVAAWHAVAFPAVLAALLASSWRWGSTSLEAWAGAQAVLGPAGAVGPGRAAAASWLAASAIVLAAPRRRGWQVPRTISAMRVHVHLPHLPHLMLAAATGATAAAVVAGPGVGGEVWVRAAATVAATILALVASTQRARHRIDTVVDAAAVVAGVGAVVLVAGDAPGWSGTVDAGALRTGALVALAVGALVAAGGRTLAALGGRAS